MTFPNRVTSRFAQQFGQQDSVSVEAIRTLISTILSPGEGPDISNDSVTLRQSLIQLAQYARSLEAEIDNLKGSPRDAHSADGSASPGATTSATADTSPSLPFAEDLVDLSEELKWMTVDPSNNRNNRFFGQSSGIMLVKTALGAKTEYSGSSPDVPLELGTKRSEFWVNYPVS